MDNLPSIQDIQKMTPDQLASIFGVRDFFVYELDFAALANGASAVPNSFTVMSDSNFLWQYGAMQVDIAAAAQTSSTQIVPLVSCTIQDQGSGRQLMSSAVPINSIFGNGQLPFPLPTPRFFRAQTQVTVALTNFSAASTYNIKLSFIGTKIFNVPQGI